MRFLIQYRKYTDTPSDWPGILATDAQSVLDTLQCGNHDPQAVETPVDLDMGHVVLDVLCPEWDVLIEIQAASKLLPTLTLQYVKGHQDRTNAYHRLDLMGQLNVDADAEAGGFFNRDHGASRPYVIMSPLTKGHLVFSDGTITGHYARELQEAATTKPLRDHIKTRNHWTGFTMQTVNWAAHGKAIERLPKKRTHLIKLVHGNLPTHALANKFDKGDRKCPACSDPHEDRAHVLRCASPVRSAWRQTFLIQIEQFLIEKQTKPSLQHRLLDSIELWMSSDTVDIQVNPNDYEADLQQVITQQNAIGWQQLFLGRFGTAWSRTQDHYYESRQQIGGRNRIQTGEKWQISVILFVWERWFTLWKQRNQEVHGHDAQTKAAATQRDIRRRLSLIYRQQHDYEPRVQELLFEDEEDHSRQQPTTVIQNWLSANEQVFRESARRLRSRIRQGVQSILPFLSRR